MCAIFGITSSPGSSETSPPPTRSATRCTCSASALGPTYRTTAPPVAAEWCLPLVAAGGAVVLYVGPSADAEQVQRVADRVGGGEVSEEPGLLVIPKVAHTPDGFPRRPGVAKKRPLA